MGLLTYRSRLSLEGQEKTPVYLRGGVLPGLKNPFGVTGYD